MYQDLFHQENIVAAHKIMTHLTLIYTTGLKFKDFELCCSMKPRSKASNFLYIEVLLTERQVATHTYAFEGLS